MAYQKPHSQQGENLGCESRSFDCSPQSSLLGRFTKFTQHGGQNMEAIIYYGWLQNLTVMSEKYLLLLAQLAKLTCYSTDLVVSRANL